MLREFSLSHCIGVASLLGLPFGQHVLNCESSADGAEIQVTVENLAPDSGLFFTPVWVAAHDGSFDLYDPGASASAGLERIAEDGAAGPLGAEFTAAASSGVAGLITAPGGFAGAPVFDPGESATLSLTVDPAMHRYLSYASMVIPSNDAFFANEDPMAIELFDSNGNFAGPFSFTILGADVLDAGTEDNTEMEAAFINQTGPDMGQATVGGVVASHAGFIGSLGTPAGTPIILGGTTAAGTNLDPVLADFTQPGATIAQVTIVPEPTSFVLAMIAGLGAAVLFKRGCCFRPT